MKLNHLLLAFSLQLLAFRASPAADVVFALRSLTGGPVANRSVLITPIWLNPANGVGAVDRLRLNSGTGTFTLTNMVEGIYDCEISAPPDRTPFRIYVPPTNAVLAVEDILVTRINNEPASPTAFAWTVSAADRRFALAGTTGGTNGFDGLALTNYSPVRLYGLGTRASPLSAQLTGTLTNDTTGLAASAAGLTNNALTQSTNIAQFTARQAIAGLPSRSPPVTAWMGTNSLTNYATGFLQGLSFDGKTNWVIATTAMLIYRAGGILGPNLGLNNSPFAGLISAYDHLGDPALTETYAYVPLDCYPMTNAYPVAAIGVFSLPALNRIAVAPVTNALDNAATAAVMPDRQQLAVFDYTHGTNFAIYDLNNLTLVRSVTLRPPIVGIQGSAYRDGQLFVMADQLSERVLISGSSTNGFLYQVDPDTGFNKLVTKVTVPGNTEWEGISFDADGNLAANEGSTGTTYTFPFSTAASSFDYDPTLMLYLKFETTNNNLFVDSSFWNPFLAITNLNGWLTNGVSGRAAAKGTNNADMAQSTYNYQFFDRYLTVATWAQINSANGSLVQRFSGGTNGQFYLSAYQNGYVNFTIVNNVGVRVDAGFYAPYAIGSNTWHHFAGTYDGQNIKVYLDANLIGTAPQTGPISRWNSTPLVMGVGSLACALDELRLYNRALTAREIQVLYASEAPNLTALSTNGLLATVAVDGLTIKGNGTPASPLVAVGGGGGTNAVLPDGLVTNNQFQVSFINLDVESITATNLVTRQDMVAHGRLFVDKTATFSTNVTAQSYAGDGNKLTNVAVITDGSSITGNGTPTNPLVAHVTGGGSAGITVNNSPTIALFGDGTPTNPVTANLVSVTTANSASVTFSGAGIPGSPLSAVATGSGGGGTVFAIHLTNNFFVSSNNYVYGGNGLTNVLPNVVLTPGDYSVNLFINAAAVDSSRPTDVVLGLSLSSPTDVTLMNSYNGGQLQYYNNNQINDMNVNSQGAIVDTFSWQALGWLHVSANTTVKVSAGSFNQGGDFNIRSGSSVVFFSLTH